MAGASAMTIVTAGAVYALRPAALRVEKANNSSDLRNEQRRFPDEAAQQARAAQASKLSRYETDAREPLWNGPQLNAAFVAQLIGQVTADAPVKTVNSAWLAYRHRTGGAQPLVFDGLV